MINLTQGSGLPVAVAGENFAVTAAISTERLEERLASCPACRSDVLADAYAVRWRGDWYHLRCAIERDERERAASEQAE